MLQTGRQTVAAAQVEAQIQERAYLTMAPHPSMDAALLMLDTGLRVGEARLLDLNCVDLEPVGEASLGYIYVGEGSQRSVT